MHIHPKSLLAAQVPGSLRGQNEPSYLGGIIAITHLNIIGGVYVQRFSGLPDGHDSRKRSIIEIIANPL